MVEGKVRRVISIGAMGLALFLACDWFESQVETNLPPYTEFLECISGQTIEQGIAPTFVWTGYDADGEVTGYQWSLDGGEWIQTALDRTTVEDLGIGEHWLTVRAVDDAGEPDPAPPECRFEVSAAGRTVDRSVLVELFTTTWCFYCPEAEEALGRLLDQLGSDRLSIVAYHGTPERDGLSTTETAARIEWYTSDPDYPVDPEGYPTAAFDGLRFVQGASSAEAAEAQYGFEIGSRSSGGSPLSLRIEGAIEGDTGSLSVVVKVEDRVEGRLALRFAVIEDGVVFPGRRTNLFNFVARDLLVDEPLDLAAVGDSIDVVRDFEIDEGWNAGNLDVVAFVQDLDTREVIQSGRLKHTP
jgi:hypothetical protein